MRFGGSRVSAHPSRTPTLGVLPHVNYRTVAPRPIRRSAGSTITTTILASEPARSGCRHTSWSTVLRSTPDDCRWLRSGPAAGAPRRRGSVNPRSIRLLATAFYDVWLITWPEGSGLGPHDHGGVRSVLHVIDGELIEIVADHVDEQPPRARVLRKGSTVWAKPSLVHDLANRSGPDATALHVYSPPLTDISFFDLRSEGECERLRTSAVLEQVPQASSDDSASLPRLHWRLLSRQPAEGRLEPADFSRSKGNPQCPVEGDSPWPANLPPWPAAGVIPSTPVLSKIGS